MAKELPRGKHYPSARTGHRPVGASLRMSQRGGKRNSVQNRKKGTLGSGSL